MSLLFPAMLAGLVGLTIPLAMHLIARHRFPVVKLPSIRFLQAERRANVFAWKLVDVPQLLLRLLLLLLLVLLMARLFAPWLSTRPAPRNLLVVIDASASMRTLVRTGSGSETLLARAQAEATRLLENITPPSRCGLIVAGAEIVQAQDLRPEPAAAIAQVGRIQACDGAGPGLVHAVAAACAQFRGRRETTNQVVVFTDLRATGFAARHQEDLALIRAVQAEMGRKLEIVLVNVGDEVVSNTAILDARVRQGEVRIGDDAHVIVRVANYSANEVSVAPRLEIDGRKEAPTAKRALPPGGEAVIDITSPMNRAQRTFARVLLSENDALAHDNAFNLPLAVADARRVLIVNGTTTGAAPAAASGLAAMGTAPAAAAATDDESAVDGATILRYALNPGRELGQAGGTGIVPTVVTPEALAGQALSKYDAIILYDVSSLPEKTLADLDTYVRLGRAILIFASGQLNPMQFNRSLAAGGKERPALSPVQIGNDLTLATPTALAGNAVNHPLLSAFSEQRRGDLGVIRFVRLRELHAQEETAQVMFRDETGRPLALEKRIEQGRVLLFCFGVELARGNLARTRVFPLLLWRLIDYVTGQIDRQPEGPLTALRAKVLDVSEPQFAFVESLQLSPAPGTVAGLPNRNLVKSPAQTVLLGGLPAGCYRLTKPPSGEGLPSPQSYARQIAVNADSRESDTLAAERPLLQELFGTDVRVMRPTEMASLVPRGAELCGLLALLLLAAYTAEALIGWWLSARRERERLIGVEA